MNGWNLNGIDVKVSVSLLNIYSMMNWTELKWMCCVRLIACLLSRETKTKLKLTNDYDTKMCDNGMRENIEHKIVLIQKHIKQKHLCVYYWFEWILWKWRFLLLLLFETCGCENEVDFDELKCCVCSMLLHCLVLIWMWRFLISNVWIYELCERLCTLHTTASECIYFWCIHKNAKSIKKHKKIHLERIDVEN